MMCLSLLRFSPLLQVLEDFIGFSASYFKNVS